MKIIKEWQDKLGISDWNITTERIKPESITYNGAGYFVGVYFNQEDLCLKEAIIYHDIDLTEESIIHELLHVANPEKDEEWINETTKQYLHSKYKY